jgi:hypothetical protein
MSAQGCRCLVDDLDGQYLALLFVTGVAKAFEGASVLGHLRHYPLEASDRGVIVAGARELNCTFQGRFEALRQLNLGP